MRRNIVEEDVTVCAKFHVEQDIVQDVEHMQPPSLRGWAMRLLQAAGERRGQGDQVFPKGGCAGR